MVRKKHATPNFQLRLKGVSKLDADSLGFSAMAEGWLARVRALLPDSGTAVLTVHRQPPGEFLVSFRATAIGETFISEAREASLEKGLEEAGTHLLEQLANPPRPPKKSLGERMREILG